MFEKEERIKKLIYISTKMGEIRGDPDPGPHKANIRDWHKFTIDQLDGAIRRHLETFKNEAGYELDWSGFKDKGPLKPQLKSKTNIWQAIVLGIMFIMLTLFVIGLVGCLVAAIISFNAYRTKRISGQEYLGNIFLGWLYIFLRIGGGSE